MCLFLSFSIPALSLSSFALLPLPGITLPGIPPTRDLTPPLQLPDEARLTKETVLALVRGSTVFINYIGACLSSFLRGAKADGLVCYPSNLREQKAAGSYSGGALLFLGEDSRRQMVLT